MHVYATVVFPKLSPVSRRMGEPRPGTRAAAVGRGMELVLAGCCMRELTGAVPRQLSTPCIELQATVRACSTSCLGPRIVGIALTYMNS